MNLNIIKICNFEQIKFKRITCVTTVHINFLKNAFIKLPYFSPPYEFSTKRIIPFIASPTQKRINSYN